MAAFSLTFGLVGSLGPAILMVKKIEIAIFSKTQARAQPSSHPTITVILPTADNLLVLNVFNRLGAHKRPASSDRAIYYQGIVNLSENS